MKTLAIFGAGGLGIEILEMAQIINDITHKWDRYIFVNNGDKADSVFGVEVMGLDEAISQYGTDIDAVVAVGEPTLREKISNQISQYGFSQPTIIHPSVRIPASSTIGAGTCIFPGVYISTNVTIKNNVLISPNAVIGHDNLVEDNAVISSTCVLAGMIHVKKNAYIGPSVTIKESLTIGEYSVAALGSVVFKDIEDGDLVIGNPARVSKRSNEKIFHA